MATLLVYPLTWPLMLRFWPPACQLPDGSTALCVTTSQYAVGRDVTAIAVSGAIGFGAAVILVLIGRTAKALRRPNTSEKNDGRSSSF